MFLDVLSFIFQICCVCMQIVAYSIGKVGFVRANSAPNKKEQQGMNMNLFF